MATSCGLTVVVRRQFIWRVMAYSAESKHLGQYVQLRFESRFRVAAKNLKYFLLSVSENLTDLANLADQVT